MADSVSEVEQKGNSDSQSVALLSCELCSKRKTKCDKRHPCSACIKAGKQCVPVVRARLPRGRRGGRKEASVELRNRVRRLEDLVQSLSGNTSTPGPQSFSDLTITNVTNSTTRYTEEEHESAGQDISLSSRSPDSAVPNNDISRLLGSTVWTQLSSEVQKHLYSFFELVAW